MSKEEINPMITKRLSEWYQKEGRDLPWRITKDPYKIWISEVILQQTRVAQGKDYYFRFIEKFPSIDKLASANEDEVLKLWQGLGYYTRARNLHAAAKQVMQHFEGRFPSKYTDIISLKGVGEYTASAISSIAFNEPQAVVDGNVYRVIARIFGIESPIHTSSGKKIIKEIAQSLLDHTNPGQHNQAMMDFGALVCSPQQPSCGECSIQEFCTAFAENRVSELPVNNRKITVKDRYFHYFHILHKEFTFIQKRNNSDIWKNLFEFPLIETPTPTEFSKLERTDSFHLIINDVSHFSVDHRLSINHQLTHQTIHTHFYRIIIPDNMPYTPPINVIKIESEQLQDYPVSRLTHKYLEII